MTGVPSAPAPLNASAQPHPSRWLRPILVTNVILQMAIVVTGGVVRLTGSGLGCPEWPHCAPGSFIPTVEQAEGFHKYIEFGNRTLTFLLGFVALAALLGLRRWAPHRPRLQFWAWAVGLGVILQAVLGGLTVLTRLHPAWVGLHFLVSLALISAAAILFWRERHGELEATPLVPRIARTLSWATVAAGLVVMVLGVIVTGSGPHAGDAKEPVRWALDPRTISWLHADAVMLFLGLLIAMVVAASLSGAERARRQWLIALVIGLAQGLIGYVQYLSDLPEVLVATHMAGATVLTVAVVFGIEALSERGVGPAVAAPIPDAGAHTS